MTTWSQTDEQGTARLAVGLSCQGLDAGSPGPCGGCSRELCAPMSRLHAKTELQSVPSVLCLLREHRGILWELRILVGWFPLACGKAVKKDWGLKT